MLADTRGTHAFECQLRTKTFLLWWTDCSQKKKDKRKDEALACLRKAVASSPKYVPALLELGTLLSADKDFAAAEALLSSAIREGGPTTAALNNLAIVYQELGNHLEAVRAYKRVLKIDEDDALG